MPTHLSERKSEMRSIPRTDGRRASDAEITRPQNEGPFEAPNAAPSWHVHLELQPEELVTLHRMGFTSGALAWREGMNDWQPLRWGDPPPLAPPKKPADRSSHPEVPMALVKRRDSEPQKPEGTDSSSELRTPSPRGAELSPRLQAFSRRARSIPPLAPPIAVPVIGTTSPRPTLELLRPPPFPAEPPTLVDLRPPSHPPALAVVSTMPPRLSDSSIREIKPASIPPPVEVPNRPLRGVGSRALWLGAAALVALSASNGALVSALLWSLRHSASASVAALSRSFNSNMCPAPNATPAGDKPQAAAALASTASSSEQKPAPKRQRPVSIDELPLVSDAKTASSSRSESHNGSSSRSSSSTSSSSSNSKSSRSKSSKVVLAEEGRRSTPSDGPPDRASMNKALSLASASASTCADGPEKGRVQVTFSPSGGVQGVRLVQSFGDASINSCVLRAMGRAHVTPFTGDAITVTKTLAW
ncbi:MAG: hypothetical protein QM756_40060 [Polyangiaceae bacterium]